MIWVKRITEKGIESIACQVSHPLIFVTFFFFVLDILKNLYHQCAKK